MTIWHGYIKTLYSHIIYLQLVEKENESNTYWINYHLLEQWSSSNKTTLGTKKNGLQKPRKVVFIATSKTL